MPRVGLDSQAVVSAAAELSDAEGLEAVTLARLAERLGIRAPSLYAHIDGLADLRRRLGARGARELGAALAEAAAGRSRLDALRAIHAVRIVRAALHGFVSLEYEGGFGIPLSIEETFTRLVGVLDRGLRDPAPGPA